MDVAVLAEQWRADLASWAIPQHILDQATEPPWRHPVDLFTVVGDIPDSPSHRIARAALPPDGCVLDVGCGGGRAAFACVPPAIRVTGVDHNAAMLAAFAAAANDRGVAHAEFLGDWLAIADEVPSADVVVCHHLAYNVPDAPALLTSLHSHAQRRVVVELPTTHPMSALNDLWQAFWGLTRPARPRGQDYAAIARALGFDVHLEVWTDDIWDARVDRTPQQRVRDTRIRLCLAEDREPEVAAALQRLPEAAPRELVTLWWDVV